VDLSKEEVKVALLSALLLPLRALQSEGKKRGTVPAVPLIVGESMKWKKTYATLAAEIQAQAPELLKVYQTLQVKSKHMTVLCTLSGTALVLEAVCMLHDAWTLCKSLIWLALQLDLHIIACMLCLNNVSCTYFIERFLKRTAASARVWVAAGRNLLQRS